MPLLVFAQDVEEVFGIEEIVSNLLGAGGWPLALAALFSLAMAVLLGRLGFKGKLIKIPWVTEWLKAKISEKLWPLVIIGVAGLIGLFTALGTEEVMTLAVAISGLIEGILFGAASIGLHQLQRKTGQAIAGKE